MAFKKHETGFEGLFIIEPDVFKDNRGYFKESYNKSHFEAIGLDLSFVQDNQSYSQKGTLRGLHFQAPPHAQGKLVCVVLGSAVDVVVDIRENSPTYGKTFSIELTAENHKMLYVPPGFAHGFGVLSNECLFSYKCTALYNRDSEMGLMWNDPELHIDWGIESPIISEKDQKNLLLKDLDTPFKQNTSFTELQT